MHSTGNMEPQTTSNRIKTYGRRASRLSNAQHRYYGLKKQIGYHSIYYYDNPSQLHKAVFQSDRRPTILEIGSGMGHATIHHALHHPFHRIVACEVYPAGIAALLHAIHRYRLTNLYIFEGDIRDMLSISPSQIAVDGIHILFPDPWPKVRHQKRRLITEQFIHRLYAITSPCGYCAVTTDHQDYAADIYSFAMAVGFKPYLFGYEPLYTRWRVQTRYEKKAIENERTCYHHIFYKPLV